MSTWQLALPAGIDDARFRGFQAVMQRLDAVPVERVLVWHIESTGADVLPHLAEFFALVGVDWSSAPPRQLLRAGIDLVRRQGTIGALRSALEAAGYPDAEILSQFQLRYDGSYRHDGAQRHGADSHYAFFFVRIDITSGAPTVAQLRELWDLVEQWGRARSPFALQLMVGALPVETYRQRP